MFVCMLAWSSSLRLTSDTNFESCLERIIVYHIVDCYDVSTVMEQLRERKMRVQLESNAFQVALVVIDCFSILMMHVLEAKSKTFSGHAFMHTLARQLKQLAKQYHFSIVSTNHCIVAARGSGGHGSNHTPHSGNHNVEGSGSGSGPGLRYKPALGASWSMIPDLQLMLSPAAALLSSPSSSSSSSSSSSAATNNASPASFATVIKTPRMKLHLRYDPRDGVPLYVRKHGVFDDKSIRTT
jgi:hypothetical protein